MASGTDARAHIIMKVGNKKEQPISLQDERLIKYFMKNVKFTDNKIIAPMLFNGEQHDLLCNKPVARRRLQALLLKFQNESDYEIQYDASIHMYLEKGYVIPKPIDTEIIWFVPHHGDYQHKKGTVRVVNDCKNKYYQRSLNDVLATGGQLLNELLGILAKWRMEEFFVIADQWKWVCMNGRELQCLEKTMSNVQEFQMTTRFWSERLPLYCMHCIK